MVIVGHKNYSQFLLNDKLTIHWNNLYPAIDSVANKSKRNIFEPRSGSNISFPVIFTWDDTLSPGGPVVDHRLWVIAPSYMGRLNWFWWGNDQKPDFSVHYGLSQVSLWKYTVMNRSISAVFEMKTKFFKYLSWSEPVYAIFPLKLNRLRPFSTVLVTLNDNEMVQDCWMS